MRMGVSYVRIAVIPSVPKILLYEKFIDKVTFFTFYY